MDSLENSNPHVPETFFVRAKRYVLNSKLGRLFLDRKFFYYTCIGGFIAVLNIFLLWLLIDVVKMKTVIASTLVIGFTFIFRYLLFHFFKLF